MATQTLELADGNYECNYIGTIDGRTEPDENEPRADDQISVYRTVEYGTLVGVTNGAPLTEDELREHYGDQLSEILAGHA